MQTLIQVFCGGKGSLRKAIAKDAKIEKYGLTVSEIKSRGRASGWSKIHSIVGSYGAINIEWDANTNMLSCRVITKKGDNPSEIISDFTWYLLARYKKRIEFINILPR
jgi:hypothetical protein